MKILARLGMWLKMNYEELTNEELLNIISEVKKELNYRKAKLEETIKEADILTDTVEFEFYEVGKYNWVPYVARCTYSKIENDGIKRVFKSLDKTKSDNEVVVAGKWKAQELQVYDIRRSKARKYYILLNGGSGDFCFSFSFQNLSPEEYYSKAWSSNTKNFVELNNAGIDTYLLTMPHNEKYNVGNKRINNVNDIVNICYKL